MPQLLFFGAIAAVAYYGYKRFVAEAERVSQKVREQEKEQKTGAIGTLKKDPVTGEYRVMADDE
ncbi:MAG: hypothetical protein AAFR13_10085 [Pseudomonadota bacterium]